MTDIFISYSRKDGEFMRMLHSKLQAAERDVWVDWEDIPATADWWDEIKVAIEAADAFAFIISSHSVRSEICRREIQHALDNNKRFIPLLFHEITDDDAPFVHPAIRSHNWIPFNDPTKYDESMQRLLDSLSTNPDYLRRHTRLLVRAKEWEQKQRQNSYLLKGAELNEYQMWLRDSQDLQPKPTELQLEYILASQAARARNQLRLAVTGIVAIVVFAFIAGFALLQNQLLRETAAQSTIAAQEQGSTQQAQLSTSQAQGTQIAAQATNIANIRSDSQSLLTQAVIQNTQVALQTENFQLKETISAFQYATSPTAIETEGEDAGLSPESAEELTATIVAVATFASSPTQVLAVSTNDAQAQNVPSPTSMSLPDTGGGARPDYFVNPYGNDNGDCSRPQTACQTISGAIAIALPDSTIEIAPGVYSENLLVDKSLSLIGKEGDNTVLNGNFAGRSITVEAGAVLHIANLTITGGTAAFGGGILNHGELSLQNVVVVGNSADLAGGGLANFGIFEAEDSDFSENYAPNFIQVYPAAGSETVINDQTYDPIGGTDGLGFNQLAEINTTDGDNLNMRPNAGRNSEPVVSLPDGTIVMIADGPVNADGLTWWRVIIPTGQTGWVVDSADDVQTLLPIE